MCNSSDYNSIRSEGRLVQMQAPRPMLVALMEQVCGARQHDFLTPLRLLTLLARTAREGRCRVFNLDQDLAGADTAHLTDTLTAVTAT